MNINRQWPTAANMHSHAYICGWCQNKVASSIGWISIQPGNNSHNGHIYLCSHCSYPTYFEVKNSVRCDQTPGISIGNSVQHVPTNLNTLYEEARRACSHNGFTSAVMLCRKILMHVAVDKEPTLAGKTFKECVEYLEKSGYVPPGGKKWVDKIRTKGNEANHEIVIMVEADAKDIIGFCEMLLKFIYEFPAKA